MDDQSGESVPVPNPGFDADMLRRAATASRNAHKQMVGEAGWFAWVPDYLDQLADRIEAIGASDGSQG